MKKKSLKNTNLPPQTPDVPTLPIDEEVPISDGTPTLMVEGKHEKTILQNLPRHGHSQYSDIFRFHRRQNQRRRRLPQIRIQNHGTI